MAEFGFPRVGRSLALKSEGRDDYCLRGYTAFPLQGPCAVNDGGVAES